ncbi:MAG: M13 family metallopeptidase [Candidatus Acidoferrales bacterium]|nr:M13 family metallopeptidase [Candidatus Acidoferrales bacterium]
MIRRLNFAIAAILLLVFPIALAAQSSSSARAKVAQPAAAASGCSEFLTGAASAAGSAAARGADERSAHGFDLTNLDRSVKPCDDFYQFSSGGWMKNNPIPSDHSTWATFTKLNAANEDALHTILEESAKDKSAAPGSNRQKIGDFYASCMDESQIEAVGAKPLDPEFQRIAAIKDIPSLQAEIASLQRIGVNAAFGFGSLQDFKDSKQVIFAAGQGGLGMPDRQYYLDDDDRSKALRAGYVQHVSNMFKLLGDDASTSAAEAKVVLDVETTFAKAATKREDLRDPEKNYHKLTLVQLAELTPHLSWPDYFKQVGAPSVSEVDVAQPDAIKAIDTALASVSLADWKTYLRWHLIHSAAPTLSAKFVDGNFDFYSRQLTGAKEDLPRWRRCVEATDGELGEALGQIYAERYFPPEAKARALELVHNLMAALREDLSTLDWMSPATREQAIHKLDAMNLKIGYPDKWRDYSAFRVDRGAYVDNVTRGDTFETARDLAKIGKPVDRTEWGMTPPTVNAYYTPLHNEIVFPAGILQPPFFDAKADDAFNYGSIGSVIGHEMTHGFDDQGAQFDADGNLKSWWTPEDLKNFRERGDCIAKQFDAFEVEPGLHGNGKLEEGESIADLGGLVIAYAAFQKTLAGKPAPPALDGFTVDQRFFLGFAAHWAANYRPEVARLRAKTDSHPLNAFRVDGALSNMPIFAKAWGCAADSKMVRPDTLRCRIW